MAPPGERSPCNTLDVDMILVVYNACHHSVLITQIKDDGWATGSYLRLQADDQMRQIYDAMHFGSLSLACGV